MIKKPFFLGRLKQILMINEEEIHPPVFSRREGGGIPLASKIPFPPYPLDLLEGLAWLSFLEKKLERVYKICAWESTPQWQKISQTFIFEVA